MANENTREYKTLVTAIGKRKIAAAVQGDGRVNITQAAVGDGGGAYYVPSSDMTALLGEVWRGSIAGKWINEQSANMIDVKVILPADIGGFTVREAALFDDDGDMIAVCNLPDTAKAVITTGAAGTLTIVLHIILTDADAVEFRIDPHLDVVTAADVKRLIDRSTVKRDIAISTAGWLPCANGEGETGMQYLDIAQKDITEDMIPLVSIHPNCLTVAANCRLCPTAETRKGALRLYAHSAPTEEIAASLVLMRASSGIAEGGSSGGYILPIATSGRLGGVKIGPGITGSEDGTISAEAILSEKEKATDEEVAEALDEVFNRAKAR